MVTLRNVLESLKKEETLSLQLLAEKLGDSPEAVQAVQAPVPKKPQQQI